MTVNEKIAELLANWEDTDDKKKQCKDCKNTNCCINDKLLMDALIKLIDSEEKK